MDTAICLRAGLRQPKAGAGVGPRARITSTGELRVLVIPALEPTPPRFARRKQR